MPERVVARFLPSTNAFRFGNAFPRGAYRYPAVPGLARIAQLDAASGVCGGLVFAVLDLFLAGRTPPSTTALPAPDSALFARLVARQRSSVLAFDRHRPLTNGGATVWWTLRPGEGAGGRGALGIATAREWARVRRDVDAGRPSPVFLVAGPRCRLLDPRDLLDALRRSHQVLAYGYAVTDDGEVTLRILDPNDPGDDASTLVFDPHGVQPLHAPHVERLMSRPPEFRGFFRAAYRHTPPNPTTT